MYIIMLVEDDQTITDVLGRQLERWGYAVCVPDDFSRIDREFLHKEPDLVLMDISLPYYDGYYWCEEIRRYSQTPIILISSAGEDMALQYQRLGGKSDDLILKEHELGAIVRRALKKTAVLFRHKDVALEPGKGTDVYIDFSQMKLEPD